MVSILNNTNTAMRPWSVLPTLLIELTGPSHTAVLEQQQRVQQICSAYNASETQLLSDPAECKELWRMRKECLWSAMAAYPDREVMTTDVCVPLSKLPVLIEETKKEIASAIPPLPCPIVAHAGGDCAI